MTRCLSFEEFSVCRSSLNYSKIDDTTMNRLYEEFYLNSVYNGVNHYDELFAILDVAEKTKLLQEALDI